MRLNTGVRKPLVNFDDHLRCLCTRAFVDDLDDAHGSSTWSPTLMLAAIG
jgi:hypothetical protein